eukprot:5230145-Pleurochrysis_carterae.AAC.3
MQVSRRVALERGDGTRASALSMYANPPTEHLSVGEFEDFALDRLRCEPSPNVGSRFVIAFLLKCTSFGYTCSQSYGRAGLAYRFCHYSLKHNVRLTLLRFYGKAFSCASPCFALYACFIAVLSMIDMARAKGLKGDALESVIRKARNELMPNTPVGARKDVYSHFILRLAYCR